jgi:hypothetical protein
LAGREALFYEKFIFSVEAGAIPGKEGSPLLDGPAIGTYLHTIVTFVEKKEKLSLRR